MEKLLNKATVRCMIKKFPSCAIRLLYQEHVGAACLCHAIEKAVGTLEHSCLKQPKDMPGRHLPRPRSGSHQRYRADRVA